MNASDNAAYVVHMAIKPTHSHTMIQSESTNDTERIDY